MDVVASVHLADVGVRRALGFLRKTPQPGSIAGLRKANVASVVAFNRSSFPAIQPGRVALVAFWDDEAAVDRFVADHPLAEVLSGGWRVTLSPLRAYGAWPGLPGDVPRRRTTEHDGPSAVLTLGRLRLPQAIRFLRTSSPAEAAVTEASGAVWNTAFVRPPFVATFSMWESVAALSAYAYETSDAPHSRAIAANAAKPFHHESAFIRFRPCTIAGSLAGKNPLREGVLALDPHPGGRP